MGNPRNHPALFSEPANQGTKHPLVAADDLRAAMGEDRGSDPRVSAPIELGADRCVANQRAAAAAQDRAGDRRAVANVQIDALQCGAEFGDRNDIGGIKETRAAVADAIADRGGPQRMLDGKGTNPQRADINRVARFDQPTVGDRVAVDPLLGLVRRIDRTRRSLREPESVVAMRVRQQDRVGLQARDLSEPVGAAIDHQPAAGRADQQRAVPPMAAGLFIDFAAGTEKPKPHVRVRRSDLEPEAPALNSQSLGPKGADPFCGP
jgi:hypothetical protein